MSQKKNKLHEAYISATNKIDSFSGGGLSKPLGANTIVKTSTPQNNNQGSIKQVDGATVDNGIVNSGRTDLLGSAYEAPTSVSTQYVNPSKVIIPYASGNKGNETTTVPTTSGETKTPLQISDLDEYKNLVNQKTSALSNLNQANQLAMKYADNTALAQGYATQGAMLQNNANLQSAYINQAGAINQNYQQQLGNLTNTKSAQTLENVYQTIQNEVANGTLTEEEGTKLLEQYGGLMNAEDMQTAQTYLNQGLKGQQISAEQNKQAQMESLTNAVIQNYGEISPAHSQVLKDFESGKITATEAINQIYASQNASGEDKVVVDSTTGKTIFTNNDKEYSIDVSTVGNAKGDKLTYQVGNVTYTVQLGGTIESTNINTRDYEVGKLYLFEDKNGEISKGERTYVVTKDSNGFVRIVTNVGNGNGYGKGLEVEGGDLGELAAQSGLFNIEEWLNNKYKEAGIDIKN